LFACSLIPAGGNPMLREMFWFGPTPLTRSSHRLILHPILLPFQFAQLLILSSSVGL